MIDGEMAFEQAGTQPEGVVYSLDSKHSANDVSTRAFFGQTRPRPRLQQQQKIGYDDRLRVVHFASHNTFSVVSSPLFS